MVRPRVFSFSKEEMIVLGEEMVKWVKEHPDMLHLSEWYTIEKGFTYKEWKNFIQLEEFLPYYEKALKIVGLKYLNKDSKVRDGISQRWQRVYFGDLRDQEDEDAKKEADLKKSTEATTPQQVILNVRSDGLAAGIDISSSTLSITTDNSSK